jgi:HEAT repeat protein
MRRLAGLCLGAGCLLLAATPVRAGSEGSKSPGEAQVLAPFLVRQLGDPSYRVREKASLALLQMGRAAKPALVAGIADGDPEVRIRCRQLLPAALASDLQARINAFLADKEGKLQHDLPGWARFQKLLGSEPAQRALFADILKTDATLLELAESDPKAATDRFNARSQQLQAAMYNITPNGQRAQVSPQEVAGLLFVGSEPRLALPPQATWPIYSLMYRPEVRTAFTATNPNDPYKKLLLYWIRERTDPNTLTQSLNLAIQLNLKECLDLALKSAGDPNVTGLNRGFAITAIGKLGTKENLPTLEALLGDSNAVGPAIGWNNVQIVTEIRDVALAMCVHLTGQSLKDYGFEILATQQTLLFSPYYCGFSDPAQRDAAHKKWKEWKATGKSEVTVPPGRPAAPSKTDPPGTRPR